jgi:hypothetical protein
MLPSVKEGGSSAVVFEEEDEDDDEDDDDDEDPSSAAESTGANIANFLVCTFIPLSVFSVVEFQ